jgi:hypothetical protein
MEAFLQSTAEFSPATPVTTINNWLEGLQQYIDPTTTKIFPKVIAYVNKANKDNQLAHTQESIDREDWMECSTLEQLATAIRGKENGHMVWVCNNVGDVVKKKEEYKEDKILGRMLWHSYLVLYRQGSIWVWDPDFVANEEGEKASRITEVRWIALVRELVKLLERKGYKIKGVYIAGGGNTGTECNRMSQEALMAWLRNGCQWDVSKYPFEALSK